jgi:hypothetical protein
MTQLTIGIDLNGTVYGHPDFFRAFIEAMHAAGHRLVCISVHGKGQWEPNDKPQLRSLGIDPDKIDVSLMPERFQDYAAKLTVINQCDFCFDDHPEMFQHLTKVPIFKAPIEGSKEVIPG